MRPNQAFIRLFREHLSKIHIPIWMGKPISKIPYRYRPGIGTDYKKIQSSIKEYKALVNSERKKWILRRIKKIVLFAESEIPFYRDLYSKQGFSSEDLNSFDDIKRIPIINKKMLKRYPLSYRSSKSAGIKVNTGGTSGSTLGLYISPEQISNEWAHIHKIWRKLGFEPSDLKIMLGGRSEFRNGLSYDVIRHSLSVSVYIELEKIASNLSKIVRLYKPRYIHGYPSVLSEFALICNEKYPDLLNSLKSCLRGGFLGSEYPVKNYRESIEGIFEIPTISWYGHTERCVLAYEKNFPYHYVPLQTYGYAEIFMERSNKYHLVGTSYFNRSSPLIRYDTEDQVLDIESKDDLLHQFRIKEGRKGDFILDKNGKKISLTGLIFGRHHELFNHCTHIQIYQKEPGYATVLFVPVDDDNTLDPKLHFDGKNVQLDFDFKKLEEPIRTNAGKVKLLVEEDPLHFQVGD